MTDTISPSEPPVLAYSIAALSKATSIGRTRIFEAIKKGRLAVLRVGGRVLITPEAARAWLANSTADDKLEHQPLPQGQRPPKRKRRP